LSHLENGAAADKTNPRRHPLHDARQAFGSHAEFKTRYDKEGRAARHQHVRSQTGRFAGAFTLVTEHGPQDGSRRQSNDESGPIVLRRAIPRSVPSENDPRYIAARG
jgi:hypothetical protein